MLSRTLSLAIGLLCAIAAAQLPELAQQYRQRLGGAIDEVRVIVERFDTDAATNRLNREQALTRLAESSDDVVRRRGQDALLNIQRLGALEEQRTVVNASSVTPTLYLLTNADDDLFYATLADFQPAVPSTTEGLLYGAVGFLFGWSLVQLVSWPYRRWREHKHRMVARGHH
jgi:hypothetical protein